MRIVQDRFYCTARATYDKVEQRFDFGTYYILKYFTKSV